MSRNTDEPSGRDFTERLFAPVDGASVVFFRAAFGLLLAWDFLTEYLLGDKLEYLFLGPFVHFKYYGFEWVRVGPDGVMKLLFWALFALSLAIAFGLWYRLSASLFFAGYLYVFLLDQSAYNNHFYLVCLLGFLLIFVRPAPEVPAWALWLLRFQVAVPYFFGGLAKCNYDWVVRAQPMHLWLSTYGGVQELFRVPVLQELWVAYFFSWGGLAFDLLIVPLLLLRRTRVAAFVLAVVFHLNNVFMFNIGFFPWLMICGTTLFLAPDWPRRLKLIRRRRPAGKGRPAPGRGPSRKGPEPPPPRRRLVLSALAVYVAVQLLLPFRYLLYPGNPDWTDQGHRFAWRMKLRDKRGDVRFVVVDKRTRQSTVFDDLESALTARQLVMVTQDPHMVRQFAHVLAERLRQGGRRDFEIRVRTSLSLNGREPQPLIDPEVDLASQPATLLPVDWILPLESGS